MIDIDYKPRHKRKLRDGQVPRGPARWGRAFGNLVDHPTSKAAGLLVDRIATAREFRDFAEFKETFEHGEVTAFRTPDEEYKPKYYTCNMFCAAMVAQLDISSTKYSDVLGLFEGTYVHTYVSSHLHALERKTVHVASWQPRIVTGAKPTRTSRCQFCGGKIRPRRR